MPVDPARYRATPQERFEAAKVATRAYYGAGLWKLRNEGTDYPPTRTYQEPEMEEIIDDHDYWRIDEEAENEIG